jgi:hypothetical protein
MDSTTLQAPHPRGGLESRILESFGHHKASDTLNPSMSIPNGSWHAKSKMIWYDDAMVDISSDYASGYCLLPEDTNEHSPFLPCVRVISVMLGNIYMASAP